MLKIVGYKEIESKKGEDFCKVWFLDDMPDERGVTGAVADSIFVPADRVCGGPLRVDCYMAIVWGRDYRGNAVVKAINVEG